MTLRETVLKWIKTFTHSYSILPYFCYKPRGYFYISILNLISWSNFLSSIPFNLLKWRPCVLMENMHFALMTEHNVLGLDRSVINLKISLRVTLANEKIMLISSLFFNCLKIIASVSLCQGIMLFPYLIYMLKNTHLRYSLWTPFEHLSCLFYFYGKKWWEKSTLLLFKVNRMLVHLKGVSKVKSRIFFNWMFVKRKLFL